MFEKIFCLCKNFINKLNDDHVSAYAAQTAFFIVLSFFPFLSLLLLSMSGFSVARSSIISMLVSVMPKEFENFVRLIINDVFFNHNNTITIVTVLVALWSAAKGIQSITRGLNQIYRVDERKNFIILRIFSAFYTLLLMLLLVVGMVVFVFGKNIVLHAIESLPSKEHIWVLIYGLRNFMTIMVIFGFLLLIYFQLPSRKGKMKNEIFGAFLASVGWVLMTKMFSFYINHFVNESYMYGSLTSILLVLMWLYFSMLIIFWGAELNYFMARHYDSVMEIKGEIKEEVKSIANKLTKD